MAWTRIDDHEALDSRVGELTDAEYRARHALMQLCSREYREHGIFPPTRIVAAAYATPKGPRALTPKQLAKLQELDFVRGRDGYSDEDIDDLGLHEWPEGHLRIHRWERYNPPRDKTNAQRQLRYRQRHNDVSNGVSNAVTNDDDNGPVTPPRAQPRARVPVPSRPVTTSLPHSTSLEDPATTDRSAVSEENLSTIGTEAQDLLERLGVARAAGLVGDPEPGGES